MRCLLKSISSVKHFRRLYVFHIGGCYSSCHCTQVNNVSAVSTDLFDLSQAHGQDLQNSMQVIPEFLSEADEQSLLGEIEPYMVRLQYEFSHWDEAIHGFRETERLKWNAINMRILDRVKEIAFSARNAAPLKLVHILDLHRDGYIKPHIDAVRFCGDTIAGLSLLSDSVMRLINEKQPKCIVDVLLNRRSLYIMSGQVRYDFTHAILGGDESRFKGVPVPRERRISVICRNEPTSNKTS